VHLPLGLFGVALMVATLPVVSRHAATRDMEGLKGAFQSSLALAFLVTLPATCGLIALAQPIVALIYQHGRFTPFDTQQTAAALAYYSLGLMAFAGVKIMVPVFYALDDTRIPVIGSFLTVGANLLFINLTVAPMQHLAIAMSTALSMILNFIFLGVMLYRKVGGFRLDNLFHTLMKVTGASLMMGLAVAGLYPLIMGLLGQGLAARLLGLLGVIAIGMGLYGGVVSFLRIPELGELLALVKRFRGKGTP
jgi:putative peptidoglycan lipid II flippase